MTSTPDADARLLESHDLALEALREITPASTIGPAAGYTVEEGGAVSLRFENRLPGYPGWYWTVTVARVDDADPTVLELELLPGDSALLAPEWVPWAERLAEYRAHQVELAEQAAAAEAAAAVADDGAEDAADADDADDEDVDDLDEDGFDDEDDEDDHEVDLLHAGDLDGVDIDELDDDAEYDEDDADEPEDDESDDEDSDAEDAPDEEE